MKKKLFEKFINYDEGIKATIFRRKMKFPMQTEFKVLTTNGEKFVSKLNVGDMLYNYLTTEPIEIRKIEKIHNDFCYLIIYSDGRSLIYGEYETLYSDFIERRYSIKTLYNNGKFDSDDCQGIILPKSYNFRKYNDISSLTDPTLIGALYAYGNWESTIANLPISTTMAQQLYGDNFIYTKIYDGIEQISFMYLSHEDIRFYDFFYKEYFDEVKDFINRRTIPLRYKYASKEDRIKFLTGIYNLDKVYTYLFGEISLKLNNEFVASEIQLMLYSLGYSSTIMRYHNDVFLSLRKLNGKIPPFIKNQKIICEILKNSNMKGYESYDSDYFIKPEIIKKIDQPFTWYRIHYDDYLAGYTTANFLPKF